LLLRHLLGPAPLDSDRDSTTERLVMPHQTLPRRTTSPSPSPSRSSHDQTPTDAGSFAFLGGVIVIVLLAVLVWQGLF
jgi:hypothetical protein